MHIAPYLSAFGLLAVYHAARVVRLRIRFRVSVGDGGHPELLQMMRVFGNFTEFVPLGLILLMACELVQSPPWFLHIAGGSLLLGRCLHAIGLSQTAGPSSPRLVGMVLTFLSLILSSIGVLLFSVYTPS